MNKVSIPSSIQLLRIFSCGLFVQQKNKKNTFRSATHLHNLYMGHLFHWTHSRCTGSWIIRKSTTRISYDKWWQSRTNIDIDQRCYPGISFNWRWKPVSSTRIHSRNCRNQRCCTDERCVGRRRNRCGAHIRRWYGSGWNSHLSSTVSVQSTARETSKAQSITIVNPINLIIVECVPTMIVTRLNL